MKNKLIKMAREAGAKAYAPYSNFHVGAAILTTSGNFYAGCNVETFNNEGHTCAEKDAIANMVSAGEVLNSSFIIDTIAVSCVDVGEVNDLSDVTPCGSCRQFISEFSDKNTKIILDDNKDYPEILIDDILPFRFHLSPTPDNKAIDNIDSDNLEELAKSVYKKAYTPNTKNKVGAAILTKSGNIYTGVALEDSSCFYVSAERSAAVKAILNGECTEDNPKFIEEIVVYVEKEKEKYIISQNLALEFLVDNGKLKII